MAVNIDDDNHDSKLVPRFFKIILEPQHALQQLGIPKQFMIENGNDLSDEVILEIPTGKTWKVELAKDENEKAWFKDGWPEFVKYNAICHGHFLVFSYEPKSQLFNVNVFDTSACEIQYRLNPQEPKPFKKRTTREAKAKNNCSRNASVSSIEMETMAAKVRHYKRKYGGVTKENIKEINSYEHYENPSFAVIMQPSYVETKFSLNVPAQFAAENLTNAKGIFTLQNTKGNKTWPVSCIGGSAHFKKIHRGWKEFVIDNRLRVGDVCVFQLMKFAHRLLKVEIIRGSAVIVVDD